MSHRAYSDKVYVDTTCPICDAEWTVFWSVEKNYGADVDGRRGITAISSDIDSRGCYHDVEEDIIDQTEDEANESLY